MSWIEHPKFRPVRNTVLESIQSNERQFRNVRPVIFLCGGHKSVNRTHVTRFIQKSVPQALLFHADDVWPLIARNPDAEALAMEKALADLSDVVLVLVESPGTFTELGAFSMYPPLRNKLLPILDHQYKADESFINTGPVRAVDRDSLFAPAIWTDFAVILSCAEELLDRLARLPEAKNALVKNLLESEKHFLLFLCDLVFIFGPASLPDLETYCKELFETVSAEAIARLVALACAMHLVRQVRVGSTDYYFRSLKDGEHPSFQVTEYLSLPTQRSKILSVLLRIPQARHVLEAATK